MKKAIHYLKQVQRQKAIINNKLEELDRLRSMSSLVTTQYGTERVQSSGSKDKMADAVCNIIMMEDEVNERIKKYMEQVKYITGIIDRLDNPEHIKAIYKRYIHGKSVKVTAIEMQCSRQWVHELCKDGLDCMDRILEGERKEQGQGVHT